MTTTKRNWLLVGLVLIGGIALWLMYAPNQGAKWESYRDQGRNAEVEPLHKRALAIWEKALEPEHPAVATSLENYADLLRKTGRVSEAKEMEARAQAIQAKRAQRNQIE